MHKRANETEVTRAYKDLHPALNISRHSGKSPSLLTYILTCKHQFKDKKYYVGQYLPKTPLKSIFKLIKRDLVAISRIQNSKNTSAKSYIAVLSTLLTKITV